MQLNGSWQPMLDISNHEAAANPDAGALDSNPFGMRIQSNGAVVADAGANALLQIAPTGVISTLAVFPNRTVQSGANTVAMQAVPTTVIEGPDGALYVGELTGFPFLQGQARVYRVPPSGGTPVVIASGFTHIIDIVLNPFNGMGYVLEHDADGLFVGSTAGRIVRVNPATGAQTVLSTPGLVEPGGIAVGPDGALYVTNFSSTAGGGQVVRVSP
jgi:streptogramin lyase